MFCLIIVNLCILLQSNVQHRLFLNNVPSFFQAKPKHILCMLCITVERGYHSLSLLMLKEAYHIMSLTDLKIKLAQFEEELEQTQAAVKTIMTNKINIYADHEYVYFTHTLM